MPMREMPDSPLEETPVKAISLKPHRASHRVHP